MKKKATKVAIFVEDGLIQHIVADGDIKIAIVDYDNVNIGEPAFKQADKPDEVIDNLYESNFIRDLSAYRSEMKNVRESFKSQKL